MRRAYCLWPIAALLLGAYGLFSGRAEESPIQTLILYGDTRGYLAPCGCTSPMSGGIARAATAIREFQDRPGATTAFVLTGALVAGRGEQGELKAECYAEAAGQKNAAALEYGSELQTLGQGLELEMDGLSNGVLLQSQLPGRDHGPQPVREPGDFEIGAIAPSSVADPGGASQLALSEDEAVDQLLARGQSKVPVLVFDGDKRGAESLARRYPQLAVIVFRSTSDPPAFPILVGNTLLVTTGYHGKNVVALSFQDGHECGYSVVDLGPDVADDPAAADVYRRYLQRVDEENLIAQVPRIKTAAFAGAAACRSCHEKAYAVWTHSGHSHAYADLTHRGHSKDPDCVSCHVVGLDSLQGFRNLISTPGLSNVGCESCHGPAGGHAANPRRIFLPKVGQRICLSCHTTDNSPGFEFKPYWRKVLH